jgi:hypothetical protein
VRLLWIRGIVGGRTGRAQGAFSAHGRLRRGYGPPFS